MGPFLITVANRFTIVADYRSLFNHPLQSDSILFQCRVINALLYFFLIYPSSTTQINKLAYTFKNDRGKLPQHNYIGPFCHFLELYPRDNHRPIINKKQIFHACTKECLTRTVYFPYISVSTWSTPLFDKNYTSSN